MTRKKFTPELEAILLDPNASPIARADAVFCMQVDGVQRHENLVVSFLDHGVPDLRFHSLMILLRWGRYSYVPLALDWLAHDPDYEVRSQMALALSNVAVASAEHRDEILRALVSSVDRDLNPIVAARSYKAVLFVLEPSRRWGVNEEHFDREKDVDQALLARYRAHDVSTQSVKS